VALYSLGLVHQLLGSDGEAWDYYDKALNKFQKAETQWPDLNATNDWMNHCKKTMLQIEQLMAYLTRARALGGSSGVQFHTLVGCLPLSANLPDTDQLIIDVAVQKVRPDLHLRRGDEDYRLVTPGQDEPPELAFSPDEEYFVLPVPHELADLMPEFQDAPYAMLSRGRPGQIQELGATVENDANILWGQFTRDQDGNIQLEVAYPDVPPNIIGGEDLDNEEERTVGRIVGIFKAA
jgi:hypothetical protein